MWDDIQIAGNFTPKSERMFNKLIKEYVHKYLSTESAG